MQLRRRAGTEGRKTYWLDCTDSHGYSAGFVQVHTADPNDRRTVDPRLAKLAAMVERAPELAEALAALEKSFPGKASPELLAARALLADLAAACPGPSGGDHAEK